MNPRIGSLCTGTGALDMAVMDVLGGSMAWHCQYEPPDKNGREDKHQYAARILAHHWPAVPNHGDLTQVDWSQVEPIDVLTAGFPCTDLSYAGLGAGIKEGTRSGLWLTIARAIGALRPRLVVLENVRAIVNRRPGLDVVLADLARLGFDAEWLCLPASGVGAPHERFRWFCAAWPADTAGPRWEGADPRGGWAAGDGRGPVADAADLGHERGWETRDGRPGPAHGHLAAADATSLGRREGGPEHARVLGGSDAPLSGAAALADATRLGQQDEPRHHAAAELVAQFGAGDRVDLRDPAEGTVEPGRGAGVVAWGVYEPAIRRWEHILGRPAPSPVDDRGRLAPVFVEWMMGLPEGHVTAVPAPPGMTAAGLRNARLKALGNGVVPAQAAHALRLLLARAGVGLVLERLAVETARLGSWEAARTLFAPDTPCAGLYATQSAAEHPSRVPLSPEAHKPVQPLPTPNP